MPSGGCLSIPRAWRGVQPALGWRHKFPERGRLAVAWRQTRPVLSHLLCAHAGGGRKEDVSAGRQRPSRGDEVERRAEGTFATSLDLCCAAVPTWEGLHHCNTAAVAAVSPSQQSGQLPGAEEDPGPSSGTNQRSVIASIVLGFCCEHVTAGLGSSQQIRTNWTEGADPGFWPTWPAPCQTSFTLCVDPPLFAPQTDSLQPSVATSSE